LQQLHWEIRHVGDLHSSFKFAELALGLVAPELIELARAGDEEDLAGVGVQAQGHLERRFELTFDQHAGDVRWKIPTRQFATVDAAKDDRRAWRDRLAVLKQKVKRRRHHADHQVDFLAGVFLHVEIAQHGLVLRIAKSRDVHVLGVDVDPAWDPVPKRRFETLIQTGEAREISVLVVQQEHALARGWIIRRAPCAGRQARQNQRAK
jgi:hypothetical protein